MLWSPPGVQHDNSPATWQLPIPLHNSGISLISVKEKVIIKLHLYILWTKGTSYVNGVEKHGKKTELLNITGVQSKQVNLFIFRFAGSRFTQC